MSEPFEVRQLAGGLVLVLFEPRRLRVALESLPTSGGVGGRATALRARDVLARWPDAAAILDGPMYSDDAAAGRILDYRYLDRAAGIDQPGRRPDRGLAIFVRDGAALARPGGVAFPADVRVGVQGYPTVVQDGVNRASRFANADRVWRAALCVMADGHLAFAAQVASMHAFGAALVAAGAKHATYTDGGGSGEVALRDGRRWGHAEDRAVASWLYVAGDPAPDAIPQPQPPIELPPPHQLRVHARGVTIQVYRAKLPGRDAAAKRAALSREIGRWKALGAVGVAPHGFTTELPAELPALVDVVRGAHGLACYAPFGLDSSDPAGKGERIGRAALIPGVAGVYFDCEGKWEDESAAVEAANAAAMGRAFRRVAPDAFAAHQPWPLPSSHWGTYPWVEFARFADLWLPQDYFGAWAAQLGRNRVRVLTPRFAADWAKLYRDKLVPAGVGASPRAPTIEGYDWEDLPHECVEVFARNETIVVWSEPFPEPAVLRAMDARRRLDEKVGLYVDGRWSGGDVVLRFQRAVNAKLPAGQRIAEDNEWGPQSDAKLFPTTATRVFQALGLAA